MSKWF
jgi:hypothetical protein